MPMIFTPSGAVILVDEEDMRLKDLAWQIVELDGQFYASDGEGHLMHDVILKPAFGYDVRHLNGVTLDNRRSNLEAVPWSTGVVPEGIPANNACGYVGVSQVGDRFQSRIRHDGKRLHVGYFPTPEQAGAAYVIKARQLGKALPA